MLSGFTCPGCSLEGGCCGQPQPKKKVSHQGGTGSIRQLGLRCCQNAAQTQPHMGARQWERKSRLCFWIRLYLLPQSPRDPRQQHFPIPSAPGRPVGPCPRVPIKGSRFVTTTAFFGTQGGVGPLTGAEVSLRMLSLAPGMLTIARTLLLCLFSDLKVQAAWLGYSPWLFSFPLGKEREHEGKVASV